MKLQFWVTIAAASASWGPSCLWAQDGLPTPQSSMNQPAASGRVLPYIDPALPNRRVPSLEPPQSDDSHPIMPDEAWPKPPPSNKLVRPSMKSGAKDKSSGEALFSKDQSEIDGPLKGISAAENSLEK